MVQAIEAISQSHARRVNTRFGERTVIDAIRLDNGEKVTIWRGANDEYSIKHIIPNARITLTLDSKGKYSLLENPALVNLVQPLPVEIVPVKPVYDHKITQNTPQNSESDQSSLSNSQKREIAQYVTEMAKLYKYCLDQVESTIGVEGDDKRAIATTLYLSAQKKFAL